MSKVVKITKLKKKAKSHVGFLSFLLVLSIIAFLLLSPIFDIEAINVSGNIKVPKEEVISASGIIYGQNIFQLDKFAVKEELMDIPYINDIIIKRDWPNKINMIVEEKEPVSVVNFYGSKLLLDRNGYILEVITDNFETDFTVLEGISVKSITTGQKLKCGEEEILESYLEILKIFENNDMLSDVEKLTLRNSDILAHLEGGHVANLGNTENLQYRILLLKEIVEKELNPAYIDLTNLDMIVTKPVWGMFDNEIETDKIDRGETIEE